MDTAVVTGFEVCAFLLEHIDERRMHGHEVDKVSAREVVELLLAPALKSRSRFTIAPPVLQLGHDRLALRGGAGRHEHAGKCLCDHPFDAAMHFLRSALYLIPHGRLDFKLEVESLSLLRCGTAIPLFHGCCNRSVPVVVPSVVTSHRSRR